VEKEVSNSRRRQAAYEVMLQPAAVGKGKCSGTHSTAFCATTSGLL